MAANSPGGTAPDEATDPWAPWIATIVAGVRRAAAPLGWDLSEAQTEGLLELGGPAEADVALPVHRGAASAGLAPPELAARLAAAFPLGGPVREVTASGAYVNVRLDPAELVQRTLALALARGAEYGHAVPDGSAVCVEHTSANPTGPFHIGRVRNAIVGDTLVRALRAAGSRVTTQYYVDDLGRQATMLTWLWTTPRESWPEPVRQAVEGHEVPGEKPDHRLGRPYPAFSAYLKEHRETAEKVAELVRRIESGAAPPEHGQIAREVLDGMLASLGRLGVSFDEFVWESQFLHDGSVERVLERLHRAPHAVREENGAWAIDAADYGLPKESTRIVVQRADGTSLYVTRDVAYHLAKFARFARAIDVLGQDHRLHAKTLEALLTELGERRRPEFVIYQDVTVPDGGRMSTRGGSAVTLDGLLDEAVVRARREVVARREDLAGPEIDAIAEAVAAGAVRFQVVRVAPEKPVAFRWEDALSFEGRSGPFVQYAYARASSVLRKGEADRPPYPFAAERLTHPDELGVVRAVAALPRTVRAAARTGHVQGLAGYAHELADRFNRFYHAVPVLKAERERASRIALVAAARQALGNALDLLGVPRLETM